MKRLILFVSFLFLIAGSSTVKAFMRGGGGRAGQQASAQKSAMTNIAYNQYNIGLSKLSAISNMKNLDDETGAQRLTTAYSDAAKAFETSSESYTKAGDMINALRSTFRATQCRAYEAIFNVRNGRLLDR